MKINKIIALGLSLACGSMLFAEPKIMQRARFPIVKELAALALQGILIVEDASIMVGNTPTARSMTYYASRFLAGAMTRAALCKLDSWVIEKTKKYIAHPNNRDKVKGPYLDTPLVNWGFLYCVPTALNILTSKKTTFPVSWLASQKPLLDDVDFDLSGSSAFLMGQLAGKRLFRLK